VENIPQAHLNQIFLEPHYVQEGQNRSKEAVNLKTPAFNTLNSDDTTIYYDKTKESNEKKQEKRANFEAIMNYMIGLPNGNNNNNIQSDKINHSNKIKEGINN